MAVKVRKYTESFQLKLTLLLLLVIGLGTLTYPFGRDQGQYATIAAAYLQGKIVYKEIFDPKPPMTYLVHAFALQVFGHSMIAIRILDLFWQIGTLLTLFAIARIIYGTASAGLIAIMIYGIAYFSCGYWTTAQSDGFLNFPLSLSILMFLLAVRETFTYGYLLSGIFLGIAVLFKYPIGILLVFYLAVLLTTRERQKLMSAGSILLGFGLIQLCFLVSLILNGALKDFLYVQFTYFPKYSFAFKNISGFSFSFHSWIDYWKQNLILFGSIPLIVKAIIDHRRRRITTGRWLLYSWWLAACFNLILQNKFYSYHFLPLVPSTALLYSDLVLSLYNTPYLSRKRVVQFCLPLIVVVCVYILYLNTHSFYIFTRDPRSYYQADKFGAYGRGDYSVKANLEVSDFIRTHSSQDDKIFVWGFEPSIYFLSERQCSSRFVYNFPLYGQFDWNEYRKEFLEDLQRDKPLYILVVENDAMPWVSGTSDDSKTAFMKFAGFRHFVLSEYRYERRIEDFTIYKVQRSQKQTDFL